MPSCTAASVRALFTLMAAAADEEEESDDDGLREVVPKRGLGAGGGDAAAAAETEEDEAAKDGAPDVPDLPVHVGALTGWSLMACCDCLRALMARSATFCAREATTCFSSKLLAPRIASWFMADCSPDFENKAAKIRLSSALLCA